MLKRRANSEEPMNLSRGRAARSQLLPDIKPHTPVASLDGSAYCGRHAEFPRDRVGPLVGFSQTFIRKVVGNKRLLTIDEIGRAHV